VIKTHGSSILIGIGEVQAELECTFDVFNRVRILKYRLNMCGSLRHPLLYFLAFVVTKAVLPVSKRPGVSFAEELRSVGTANLRMGFQHASIRVQYIQMRIKGSLILFPCMGICSKCARPLITLERSLCSKQMCQAIQSNLDPT